MTIKGTVWQHWSAQQAGVMGVLLNLLHEPIDKSLEEDLW